jgi:hypothetical protein
MIQPWICGVRGNDLGGALSRTLEEELFSREGRHDNAAVVLLYRQINGLGDSD